MPGQGSRVLWANLLRLDMSDIHRIADPLRSAKTTPTLAPVVPLLFIGALSSGVVIWVALTSGLYSDFVLWYESGRALREGRDLYFSPVSRPGFRNMSPPQQVVLMAPLAWLSIRDALIAWWLISAAAMAGCVMLWRRVLPQGWPLALFALLFASPAGYHNVRYANQSWVIAWAVTWAWVAWRQQQFRRAAFILGAAASIKLFLLAILPYLCWRRRWTAVGWYLAGVVTTVSLGLAVCGPEAFRSWYMALKELTWQGQGLSMAVLGALTRALAPRFSNLEPLIVMPGLIVPLWLAVSALLAGAVWWSLRRSHSSDIDLAAVLLCMLLVTPSGWVYYLPLAAGPIASVAAIGPRSWWWAVGSVALLFPYPLLGMGQPSAWATMTIASSYFWGGAVLLMAVLRTAGWHTMLVRGRSQAHG